MKRFNRNWLKYNSMKGITWNARGKNVEVEGKKKWNEKGGKINEAINEQAWKKWSVKCQVKCQVETLR